MIVPQNVEIIKQEEDLKLYHYTDKAQHSSPSDFWKGIVMNGNEIVARSFPWSKTVVTDVLPEDQVFTPLYEATILRFYRFEGKPMIGTHRQIDISNKDSRVTPSSRRFVDLVQDAIAAWDYSEYHYEIPSESDDFNGNPISIEKKSRKGFAFTPTDWQSLCVEGWCHVFLLVDTSNQITDLTDLSEVYEETNEDGEVELHTFTAPRLIHAISFCQDSKTDENGIVQMIPVTGGVIYDLPKEEDGYEQHTWIIPQLKVMNRSEAESFLDEGCAVIGFSPNNPDQTTKYISYEYNEALKRAGETFNIVHRWHQLMDISNEDASEYIAHLPHHLKHVQLKDMFDAHAKYIEESSEYIATNVVNRFMRQDASIEGRFYEQVKDIINDALLYLQKKFKKTKPAAKILANEAQGHVLQALLTLPYKDQHSIHRKVTIAKKEK